MMRLRTISLLLVLLIVGTLPLLAQTELFARKFTIPPPVTDVGWGEAIGGVDFDNDGLLEIYAVNTNMYDGAGGELIPMIFKYELNSAGDTWNLVWSDTLSGIYQNTWPALTYGDWDKDGKYEIIWGPPNNFTNGNNYPERVFVYEAKGDGSDVMGVDDNVDGLYRPNAKWVIDTASAYNLRPFRWTLHDIDSDGADELIFCERASSSGGVGYKMGVISVSNIPDAGDGSETWTLEASGKGVPTAAQTVYDIAVIDSTAYGFHAGSAGAVTRIRFRDGAYIVDSSSVAPTGVIGGGWKNAQVADIDGDGFMEIMTAGYSSTSNNKIWVTRVKAGGDSLFPTQIYDPNTIMGSGTRLLGSVAGDIDGDGLLDIIFGDRDSIPVGKLLRVEYKGAGSATDPASYDFSILEQGFGSAVGAERYDFFSLMNLDTDPEPEILYGTGYGGEYDIPMIILDRILVPNAPISIANARIDANVDYVPDLLGQTVTVIGTVTTPTMGSSTQFNRFMEDGTGGVCVFKSGLTAPVVSYNVKERLYVTGVVSQYNGLDEIVPATMADVIPLGPVYSVSPPVVTIDQLLAGGEAYESRLVSLKAVGKKPGSVAWPNPGSSANMTIWDGASSMTMRVVSYTEVDDSAEVKWPVNMMGIVQQFDNSAPYSSGYQVSPRFYADFTQGVATTPNPKFALVSPAKGSTITLTDSAQIVTFGWSPAVDLDGDSLTYAWSPIGGSIVSASFDTTLNRTAKQLLSFFTTSDTVTLKWRVGAHENKTGGATVYSLDTSNVILIKNIISGVGDYTPMPTEFALDQNYPNPFNPTTTIRVSLPQAAVVTLKVYNLLGQEVASLLEGEKNAGYVTTIWNGRDQYGNAVASGMYIYRMVARPVAGGEEFVTQKKMMMLK